MTAVRRSSTRARHYVLYSEFGIQNIRSSSDIDNYDFNQSILERIILRLKDKTSMKIVLLEAPLNPLFVEKYMGASFYHAHKNRIGDFAKKHGIPYWNVTDMIGVEKDDFYDWTHFRKLELTERYTSILSELLIELDESDRN